MSQLDFQQQQAVETESWRAMVIAGAGSGKTRVLTERIAHLIENCKVSPSEILAMTFTRKAAGEMQSRLEERIGNSAFGLCLGTMHALALRMINRFGEVIGLKSRKVTIYSEWEEAYLLRDVALEMGLYDGKKWKGMKAGDVMSVLGGYYQRGVEPEDSDPVHDIFRAFIQRCRENNAMTYGGLMVGLRLLIPTMAKYLNIKHILVDEVQDIDHLQWDIILEMEKQFGAALFVVGDVDQCQPAGTMVMLSDGDEIPIEELNPAVHQLRIYDKHDAAVYGGHNKGFNFRVVKSPYRGKLIRVSAEGKQTECTPEHKWWVRWSPKSINKYVVYIMRKGARYRVGWCKLFSPKGFFHLGARSRIEKADETWILKRFDTNREASLCEQIISVKYGIPTIMFTPTNKTPLYDEKGIDLVFNSLEGLPGKASTCLRDHGRSILHPVWERESVHEKQGQGKIIGVVGYNLIDELFMIPLRSGERDIRWATARIDSREAPGEIDVYSLDVEKHHTYVANGICTRNSVYEWRGAAPKYLVDHQDEFWIYRLESNYRSVPSIVEASNRLITHNQDRITKTMVATREDGPARVIIQKECDSEFLASLLKDYTDQAGVDPVAVLGRNHFLLEKLSRLLEERGVVHEYIGRTTALTNSESFRRYHAFLKLAVNEFDNFSFLLIKDIVGIPRDQYSAIRILAAEKGKSHFQVWCGDEKPYEGKTLSQITEGLDKRFPELSPEASAFISAWDKDNFGSIEDYLNWLALWDLQDEIKKETTGITLMTGHACKGLQFPVVIIAGANEEIIPSKQSIAKGDIESERRLFYVMITRAQDQLIVTCRPEHTEKDGRLYESPASRFIEEAL